MCTKILKNRFVNVKINTKYKIVSILDGNHWKFISRRSVDEVKGKVDKNETQMSKIVRINQK